MHISRDRFWEKIFLSRDVIDGPLWESLPTNQTTRQLRRESVARYLQTSRRHRLLDVEELPYDEAILRPAAQLIRQSKERAPIQNAAFEHNFAAAYC